jgi:hypothetical protein
MKSYIKSILVFVVDNLMENGNSVGICNTTNNIDINFDIFNSFNSDLEERQ